ncbi:hypothetical protein SteCoe_13973 [Stentor coeruleus]|uniref:VPS9 domain-containing protein n=1 Tax=Stentor coeruleus TaxID=5963 RepID=A0A1R2C765_9CILI|nr:hypothetical protein SteCoe_13973 [Stentor coeruleus]
MGSGNSHNKLDYKKNYLQSVKEKKREYINQKKDLQMIFEFNNWKDYIIKEIEILKSKLPESLWVYELQNFAQSWNNYKDYPWRWNLIWFDYLDTTKSQIINIRRTRSSLQLPVFYEDKPEIFDAENLYDLLHNQFLNSNNNFIGGLIVIFNTYFYQQHFDELQSVDGWGEGRDVVKELVEEIKSFVFLSIQALSNYYGGIIIEKINETPGKVYDFMVEETFLEYIHEILMRGFLLANYKSESIYQEKLQKYQKITCADLQIKKAFQLDLNSSTPAYDKAIEKLQKIESVFSPFKKLNIIIQTSRMICECIDDYWTDKIISEEHLMVDADQILSIFTYIVLKAHINNLAGHIKIIQEFARFITNNSSMGYYVTTIEACLEQIKNMEL